MLYLYTVCANAGGNFPSVQATSYRKARKIAASFRDSFHSHVEVIQGETVEYDRQGFPRNIRDSWSRNGKKWIRVNP